MPALHLEQAPTRVPYPTPPAVLVQLPGYVPDLHMRALDGRVCLLCDADWPCAGAKRQLRDARRFTHSFWRDDRHFAELARSLATQERADTRRKERKQADHA